MVKKQSRASKGKHKKGNFRDFLVNRFPILESPGIYPQELVALHYDLRPIVRSGIPFCGLRALKETCSELGLKSLIMESYGPSKNSCIYLISKSKKKLKEYYELEKKYAGSFQLGKYLGYPSCCVEEFSKNRNHPIKTFSNTEGKLNFRLNYLYNFDSRKFNYQEFNRICKSYHLSGLYLIPHMPCSFNCKESIKYAQKLLNILRLDFRGYYRKLVFYLKKPTLYFNDFVFFPLIGKIGNNSLSYQGFIRIHNRLPTRIVESLQRGNLIKEENSNLHIYRDNYYVNKLPSGAKLFNFE